MSISRLATSRFLVSQQMERAIGIYIKAEPNQSDSWREKKHWDALQHLTHEVEEVRKTPDLEGKYHNALDCVGQAAILAATIELEIQQRLKE